MPTEQNKILDGLKQQLTTASQTLSSMSAPKISASSLTSPVAPLQIPQYTPPAQTPFVPAPLTQATQTAQTALDASQADLGAIYDKLGTQSQRKQQLETDQGIPAINSRLSELNALDAQYAAELTGITANELKQNVTGDLATNYAPLRNAISAQDTRLNIQKQQSVNIKRATNAAATAAATGQLALAQEYVQKALDAEFEPLKYQLEYKKMIYDRNKDTFDAAEKRQFEAVLRTDERKYEEQKTNKEALLSYITLASQNGAPQTVIAEASRLNDPFKALDMLSPYFKDPNADLDRRYKEAQINSLNRSNSGGGSSGLTNYQQTQAFLGISNKYQADPIVQVATKGSTAVAIADQVLADPSNAVNQLKSLYVLVKNLDADSAVREGELALAQQTQSYFDTFKNTIARVQDGRIISPDAAVQLAQATKELATAWNTSAQRRQQAYIAQANVAGVGDQFGQYLSGYDSSFQTPPTQQQGFSEQELNGLTFADEPKKVGGPFSAVANGVRSLFGL